MSLLLGAFFGFLVVFAPQGGLSQLLQLLFLINIMLGVFNILPAFPMDGGRVFRSYLERKYNSYKATMLTIRTSQVVMVLFIIATLVYVVVISASADYKEFVLLWNLLIVFFLFSGAQAEKETMEIKKRSAGMRVSEVTNSHFALVSPSDNAQKLYDTMKRTREHLLITKLGSDYAYLNLLRREKLTSGTSAGEIATKIPSIKSSASLIDALELMEMNEVGLIAVTRGKRLAGIVTLSHLQAYLSLHVPESGKEK
jgi:CBS domain-containing protein